MRLLLALSILLTSASLVAAQEQERRLMDRLLRPDTTLQNSSQAKRFEANRSVAGKAANTRSVVTREASAQGFHGERSFLSRLFHTSAFDRSKRAANLSTRSPAERTATFAAQTSVTPRHAREEGGRESTAGFSGTRPFLEQGKSQKSLSAQDRPLTIEQVRELLNRNK